MKTIRRTIYPTARILDAKAGLVEYVASDETVDAYKEVIRVNGWKFDMFRKNAPFVDSHNYDSLDCLVGKVADFKLGQVQGKPALIETVQWAVDVPENKLAQLGFKMVEAGYLKAVSVGFWPVKAVSKWDNDPTGYQAQLKELGADPQSGPRAIYLEQQQVELSACIIGANPNALAKAYKAELLNEQDLEWMSGLAQTLALPVEENLSLETERETARPATVPADAGLAQQRARLDLWATVIALAADQ